MKKIMPVGIDIETIPTQDEDKIAYHKLQAEGKTPTPPKTKGDMAKDLEFPEEAANGLTASDLSKMWIDKFRLAAVEKAFDESYRKTSFSAADGGEIISISMKPFGQADVATAYRYKGGDSECSLLKRVCAYMDKLDDYAKQNNSTIQLVGANVMLFDARFIGQRCLINGIEPPKMGLIASRYDKTKYFDVLSAWSFDDNQSRISLNRLCGILGVETPKGDEQGDIHGGMVWDIWNNDGEDGAARIARYNARDTSVLEPIYEKLVKLLGVNYAA